jgi:hypothetical protein
MENKIQRIRISTDKLFKLVREYLEKKHPRLPLDGNITISSYDFSGENDYIEFELEEENEGEDIT